MNYPFAISRLFVPQLLLLVCGCGNSGLTTYPVEGRVVLADGSPMAGGVIEFESTMGGATINARAAIGTDGSFRMVTPPDFDGAVVGNHRVVVRGLPPADEPDVGERSRAAVPQIDPRFGQFATSKLQVTVEPKPNQLTIELQPP